MGIQLSNLVAYQKLAAASGRFNAYKMVKYTKKICRLLSTNCWIVFDHFWGWRLMSYDPVKHL